MQRDRNLRRARERPEDLRARTEALVHGSDRRPLPTARLQTTLRNASRIDGCLSADQPYSDAAKQIQTIRDPLHNHRCDRLISARKRREIKQHCGTRA